MTIKIESRSVKDVTILTLAGHVAYDESPELRKTIEKLLAAGKKKIVLEYGEVTYQDSSGNGVLVVSYTKTVNAGGDLVLVSPSTKISDLLQITKLCTVFKVFDNIKGALSYFGVSEKDQIGSSSE